MVITINAFVRGGKKVRKKPARSHLKIIPSRDSRRLKVEINKSSFHNFYLFVMTIKRVPQLSINEHFRALSFLNKSCLFGNSHH